MGQKSQQDQKDPKTGIERRQLRRIPFERDVDIMGMGKTRSLNLSLGGIFLKTGAELSAGKILILRFQLSDEDREFITANSRVVFSRTGIGTGFEFKNLPWKTLEKLSAFLEGK